MNSHSFSQRRDTMLNPFWLIAVQDVLNAIIEQDESLAAQYPQLSSSALFIHVAEISTTIRCQLRHNQLQLKLQDNSAGSAQGNEQEPFIQPNIGQLLHAMVNHPSANEWLQTVTAAGEDKQLNAWVKFFLDLIQSVPERFSSLLHANLFSELSRVFGGMLSATRELTHLFSHGGGSVDNRDDWLMQFAVQPLPSAKTDIERERDELQRRLLKVNERLKQASDNSI